MEMKSVTRSLRILEAVAQHQPVTVGELTKLFGLPKSTVQRTLVTLAEAGWLRANRKDTTRWEIGARVLAVRPAALQGSSLFAAAREPMIRLRDTVNETIHLSVPDALHSMVVVDRVDCDHPVRTFHTVGDTSPLHATAVGRAILAQLPKRDVEELRVGHVRGVRRADHHRSQGAAHGAPAGPRARLRRQPQPVPPGDLRHRGPRPGR
ncbi:MULTISPECIES: helix-turn-helix domain-containing protein [Streptomyces]|uniref:IclR family transcriptional regulator n=1 Tax=Streptomyces TaxID=1883 RepID=UPI0023518D10|nr:MULTISPECIES: helix-turn-helix domain-containing protein [Streptomyces]